MSSPFPRTRFQIACLLGLSVLLGSANVASAVTCQKGERTPEALEPVEIKSVLPSQGIEPDSVLAIGGYGFGQIDAWPDFTTFEIVDATGAVHPIDSYRVVSDNEILVNVPAFVAPGPGTVEIGIGCTYIWWEVTESIASGYSTHTSVGSSFGLGFASVSSILESHPGSASVLYIDVNGHQASGVNFDLYERDASGNDVPVLLDVNIQRYQGAPAEVQDIWRRVGEDYAPFELNVTTDPRVYQHAVDQGAPGSVIERVVVGGDQWDIGLAYRRNEVGGAVDLGSGLAIVPTIKDSALRTTKHLARSVSHEAAHEFSLLVLRATGVNVYFSHRANARPDTSSLMGPYEEHLRDIWATGPDLEGKFVDEVDVLEQALGLRADEESGFEQISSTLAGRGIIERLDDEDTFGFVVTGPGSFEIRVDTINDGGNDHAANLDADFELWRDGDSTPLVATADRQQIDPLSAVIEYTVPSGGQGVYRVVAKSRGGYDDLGQYLIFAEGGNLALMSTGGLQIDPPPGTGPGTTADPVLQTPKLVIGAPHVSIGTGFTTGGSTQSSGSSSTSAPESKLPQLKYRPVLLLR